jgi:hypothetical protein
MESEDENVIVISHLHLFLISAPLLTCKLNLPAATSPPSRFAACLFLAVFCLPLKPRLQLQQNTRCDEDTHGVRDLRVLEFLEEEGDDVVIVNHVSPSSYVALLYFFICIVGILFEWYIHIMRLDITTHTCPYSS